MPPPNLNDLLEEFDILEYLDSAGYETTYIGGKTQYLLSTCPHCEKSLHCGLNPSSKKYGCYKCGVGGSILSLIIKISGSYTEALKILNNGVVDKHVDISTLNLLTEPFSKFDALEEKIKPCRLPEFYESLYNKRIPYLDTGRKYPISQDIVNYYQFGVCNYGPYKDRLIICDVNENNIPIYWVARDITGKQEIKVKNPTDSYTSVSTGDILFNFNLAKSASWVILVEGVFDALHIGKNAVSTFGKSLRYSTIFWLLKSKCENLVIMYDGDVSMKELKKYAIIASQFFKVKLVRLPNGKDPDEIPKEELIKLINNTPFFSEGRVDNVGVYLHV